MRLTKKRGGGKKELKLLGIDTHQPLELTKSMIDKAYRKQSLKVHPDRNKNDPRATEKMRELNDARDVLKHKASSGFYSFVPSPQPAQQPPPRAQQPPPRAPPPQSTYNFGNFRQRSPPPGGPGDSRGFNPANTQRPARSPPRYTQRRPRTPSRRPRTPSRSPRTPSRSPPRDVYGRMQDLLKQTQREHGVMPNVVSNDSDFKYDPEDDILKLPRHR